jgi:hypothetical protein
MSKDELTPEEFSDQLGKILGLALGIAVPAPSHDDVLEEITTNERTDRAWMVENLSCTHCDREHDAVFVTTCTEEHMRALREQTRVITQNPIIIGAYDREEGIRYARLDVEEAKQLVNVLTMAIAHVESLARQIDDR